MTDAGRYPEASQATSALIWSLVALACCPPAAVIGFIQGRGEAKAIERELRNPDNFGTARAAWIIASIAFVFWTIALFAVSALVLAGTLAEWRSWR